MSGCESLSYSTSEETQQQWQDSSAGGVDDSATQIREFEAHFEKLAFGDGSKNSFDDGRSPSDSTSTPGFETSPPAPEINVTGPNSEKLEIVAGTVDPDVFADFCASFGLFGSRSAPPCLDVDVPGVADPAAVERQRVIRRQQQKFFRVAGVDVNPNFLTVDPTGAAASSKSESSILDVCPANNDGPLLAKAPKLSSGKLETRAPLPLGAFANRKTSIPSGTSSFASNKQFVSSSDAAAAVLKTKQLVFSFVLLRGVPRQKQPLHVSVP
jgi:hypothetical protein